MTCKPLVIWGASGHARVVAETLRLTGQYNIYGFLDNVNLERKGESFCGSRILGGNEQLDTLITLGVHHLVFGFGDCQARLNFAPQVKEKGFELATLIHPTAIISPDATIAPGSFVAPAAVVNTGSRIGENVIINTCASVDHDCDIKAGSHICPGVHLGGHVVVGQGTWVGIGAAVRDHIVIGKGSVIGAGAVVIDDIPDGVVAYGVPARVMRPL